MRGSETRQGFALMGGAGVHFDWTNRKASLNGKPFAQRARLARWFVFPDHAPGANFRGHPGSRKGTHVDEKCNRSGKDQNGVPARCALWLGLVAPSTTELAELSGKGQCRCQK